MSAKTLRIAVVAPHYAEYAVRLSIALARLADVLLVVDKTNLRAECSPTLIAEARGSLKLVAHDWHSRLGRVRTLVLLPLQLLLFRPRLVHVQEQPDKTTARLMRMVRPLYPVMLTVHDPRPHSGRDGDYFRRQDAYRRVLRDGASAFHVHGPYCERELIATAGSEREIVSTQHGVILVPGEGDLCDMEQGRLLLFGRMEAYKGIPDVLAAAEMLASRGIRFKLVLAGRGPEIDRLMSQGEVPDSIEIMSKFLSPAEATEQFQRAAIVLVPYRDATQSGVVAAAIGNDRPVVATRVGGLVDAVDDGASGVLVEPARPDLLADTLEKLLSDPARLESLAAGAKAEAQGRFAWSVIATTLVDAYKRHVQR